MGESGHTDACEEQNFDLFKSLMHRLASLLVVLLVICAGPRQTAAAQTADTQCPEAADYVSPDSSLNYFAEAIRSGHPVNILALGSGSSAMTEESGFLAQMMQALHAAKPNVVFRLTVRVRHGITAQEMLADLKQVLEERHYALVLWQTGTVDAVQDLQIDQFADSLQEGAQLITARDGNLVLIDQQFSRFLRANADLSPYTEAMEAVAALPGVVLFHRFGLMHSWVHAHALDLERTPTGQQAATVALLHHCLGQSLATFLLNGTAQQSG